MQFSAAERHAEFGCVQCLTGKQQTVPVVLGQTVVDEFGEKRVVDAVQFIACHRVAERKQRGADLVEASGSRNGFHNAQFAALFQQTE